MTENATMISVCIKNDPAGQISKLTQHKYVGIFS